MRRQSLSEPALNAIRDVTVPKDTLGIYQLVRSVTPPSRSHI
jgi:hypothetical protein